jgi:hypothetical protein
VNSYTLIRIWSSSLGQKHSNSDIVVWVIAMDAIDGSRITPNNSGQVIRNATFNIKGQLLSRTEGVRSRP